MYSNLRNSATAIATILPLFFAACEASAADISEKEEAQLREAGYTERSWQGLYGSVGLGTEIVSSEYDWDTLSERDYFGNVRLGYDFQRGRFVGGPLVEARWTNMSTYYADSEWAYAVGARAGLVFGNTLLYGIAKYDFRDFNGFVGDLEGVSAGAGAEVHLGGNFFGGIEYNHFFEQEETAGLFDSDVSSDSVMVTFTVKGDPTN